MVKNKKEENSKNINKSGIALYRKYRPENFDEVIGQDHIVKAIGGALLAGKISHAYLLCGPRGTGKTTIARIIAKEIGTSVNDIYELDAASNRGIDDVRSIRDSVHTSPFDSKYKVYILDEVHMFTKDAWNALLKTIEEPPSHVVFILATTELEKVPETIVSRCQSFIFKRPTDETLSRVISNVADKEGYELENGVSELVALLADGAFRDALGILQKVISYSKDKKITYQEVLDITGSPDVKLVEDFIDSLVEENLEKGFTCLEKAGEKNIDVNIFLKMILVKLRSILVLRYVSEMKSYLEKTLSVNDFDYISKIAQAKPEKINSNTLYILLEASQNMKKTPIARLPLELALLDIINKNK